MSGDLAQQFQGQSVAQGSQIVASYTRTVSAEGEVLSDETLLDPELVDLVASLDGAERLPDGRATTTQSGAWSDGVNEHRYDLIEIIEPSNEPLGERPEPPFPVEAHPVVAQPEGPRYSPEIDQLPPDEATEVHLQLRQRPQTRLHWRRAAALASFTGGQDANAHKRAVLAARRAEIAELQTDVKALALSLGAGTFESFLLKNAATVVLPAGNAAALAEHPQVKYVGLPGGGEPDSSLTWDSQDVYNSDGLGLKPLADYGYQGSKFASISGGRTIRIGVIDTDFDNDHPGFKDGAGAAPSRVLQTWQCDGSSCSSPNTQTPTNEHGTRVAGLAAGDLTEGQFGDSNSGTWRRERSGVAWEANLYFLRQIGGTNCARVARAIEQLISLDASGDVDVIVNSQGTSTINSGTCDSVSDCSIEEDVWAAHDAGIFFLNSAGNDWNASACNLTGIAESLSAFVVGSLGDAADDCIASNYSSCSLTGPLPLPAPDGPPVRGTEHGGTAVFVDGVGHLAAATNISVMAPGCNNYGFWFDGTINTGSSPTSYCSTSSATPYVGGGAAVIKDLHLSKGHTSFDSQEGRLFVAMLAMGDRASGISSYNSFGYHPHWGAGRLQLRMMDAAGHSPGSAWAWHAANIELSDGETYDFQFQGTGNESALLNQFKATMAFWEIDNTDVADITMELRDQNCGSGSVGLGSDFSYDVKKMIRVGTSAAGKALCLRIKAWHVPTGQTRKVQVFAYLSADTDMR